MSKQIGNVFVSDNTYSDVLAHHGILGMRWGIRRYQRKDGTLTAAGKSRYQKLEKRLTRVTNTGHKDYEDAGSSRLDRLTEASKRGKIIQQSKYEFTGASPDGSTLYTASLKNGIRRIRFTPYMSKYSSGEEFDKTMDDGVSIFKSNEKKLLKEMTYFLGNRWDQDEEMPADTSKFKLLSLEILDDPSDENVSYIASYDDNMQYGGHLLSVEFDKKGRPTHYGFDG